MKSFALCAAVYLVGCGLATRGYDISYSAPAYRSQRASYERQEMASPVTEMAVPISPVHPLGCDPSFQLELRNVSENHDASVTLHRLISDGTTFETRVNVPRGGGRIICLPDLGEYEFEIELYAMNLGQPRLVGCYSWRSSYTGAIGMNGRHLFFVGDTNASRC